MSIDIPKRRLLSLFDDPQADARHYLEMQRYREALAAGRPYVLGSTVGVVESLFGGASPHPTAGLSPRDGIDPGVVENALPELLPEHEEDPHDTAASERPPPSVHAADATHRSPHTADRVAERSGRDSRSSPPASKPQVGGAYEEGSKVVYEYADGSREVREGGTRSWRNNNPGNIKYEKGGFAPRHGAVGQAGGMAIFPTEAAGREALSTLLHTPKYQAMTLDDLVKNYAPPTENDTARYQAFVRKQLGVPGETPVNHLSGEQMKALQSSIIRFEGWRPGPGKVLFDRGG